MVVNDYDDATVPASVSVLQQYPNLSICGPGEKHIRKIRPHQAVATTSSAGTSISGVKNMPAGWMDIAFGTVNHYGVKVCVTQSTSTNTNSWYVFCRVTYSLRSQR